MNSILKLLQYLQDNWATIVAIMTLIIGLYFKAKDEIVKWRAKTEEQRAAEAKAIQDKAIAEVREALKNYVLSLVAKMEIEWNDKGSKMGPVKRANLIQQIYEQYPILMTVADQEELLKYIDSLISNALETIRTTMRVDKEVSE